MKKKILFVAAALSASLLILSQSSLAQVVIQGVLQLGPTAFSGQATFADGTAGAPAVAFASTPVLGLYKYNATYLGVTASVGNTPILLGSSGEYLSSLSVIHWGSSSTDAGIGSDTGLSRTAAGILGVGNGTQGDASGTLTAATINGNAQVGVGNNIRSVNFGTRITFPTADGMMALINNAQTVGSQLNVSALPTVASGFGTSPSVTAGSTPFAGSVNVGTGASSSGIINFNGTAFPSAPFCIANDDSSVLAVRPSATTTQLTLSAVAFTASDVISWICVSSK